MDDLPSTPKAGTVRVAEVPVIKSAIAAVFDGRGGVARVPTDQEHTRVPAKGFILIAGRGQDPAFKVWLKEELGMFNADMLGNRTSRSRCTVLDDKAMAIFRVIRPGAEADDVGRQFASLWIEKGRVIIASELNIPEFFGFSQWETSHHAPISPADFVARLCLRATDRLEPLVERLGDELDDIEDELLETRRDDSRAKLAELRRTLISFRKLLWPQRDVLNTLEIEDLSFFTVSDRRKLREAGARASRLGDELQALSERAVLVHEQIMDGRAEEMNRAMLILAAVTVVFMPLTVISGVLGMNVAGIPFADNPHAFWIVALLLGLLGVGTMWWMHHRKWL
ncbi:MAG TPA: CorA family divalent cation transporter [Devosiaceae bacterium]|jgi:zinc transporter